MSKNINIFLFLFLFYTSSFYSQIKIHKHITQEDGLVNGQVAAMLQDSKGYIWFATYGGVSKWDGNKFENIQTHNGLLSSVVLSIKEGLDGKIYMGCYQGGVLIYDNGSLDTLNKANGLLSNNIFNVTMFPNGEFLFCGIGSEISKLRNGKLSNWGKEVNYPNDVNYTIRDSYFDKDGTLYLATQKGLLIYKNNSFKILTTKDGLNHNLLFGVSGNDEGTVYIGSYKGINKIKNGVITKLTNLPLFKNSFTRSIDVTKDGTMYAALDNGILKEKNGIIETFTKQNGLSFNFCHSTLEDNNGTIYFGTNGNGISIYNPNESIINYNKNTGLPNESIWAIYKTKEGTLYLGSAKGLIIKDQSSIKFLDKNDGLVDNYIRVIKESKEGNILIGTNSGLSILNNNKIKNFPLDNKTGVTRVYSILETDTGNIYVGTQTGLVIIKDGEVVENEKSKKITKAMLKELGGENILSLSKTKDGSIVLGSMSGVAIYSKDSLTFFSTKNGLVNNSSGVTHVRADGTILIGTLKGVNVIKNGEVTDTIDVNDGLSNNAIADIEEDSKGRLFVSTYNGVNILTNIYDSLIIKHLYKKDGLIGNDVTHEGTFVDAEGNLWIGTLFGITKYNPNADKPITTPPKLYFTGLQLFNKDIPFVDNLLFNYDENFLKFIFTGINLSAPEKIKYKYRLSGVDRNWVESNQNFANYTSLNNGNYTFEVKARNEWGYWSKPISASFTIKPAWWQTWWAKLFMVLIISFLIWSVFQYRLNYLLKVERLRTKIASDLHDDVGSLLTQISINADSLNYTNDSKKIKEKSGFIVNKSGEVIDLMRDVIWSIDTRNDTLESLVDRIHNFALEFLPQKNIKLEFNNQIKDLNIKLKIDVRQNIMMIAKEAINNSVKYSECDVIKIDLSYNNKKFEMIIADNGKGLDFENIKLGNGLKNMRMRAEMIDAVINFKNEDGMIVCLTKNKI